MSETINDIIREMRSVGDYPMYRKPVFSSPKFVSTSYIKNFKKSPEGLYFGETVVVEDPRVVEVHVYELAARILAAHKRELAAKDEEIERLRAALKPVLAVCPTSYESHFVSGGCWRVPLYDGKLCEASVLEAQRIYKEVTK